MIIVFLFPKFNPVKRRLASSAWNGPDLLRCQHAQIGPMGPIPPDPPSRSCRKKCNCGSPEHQARRKSDPRVRDTNAMNAESPESAQGEPRAKLGQLQTCRLRNEERGGVRAPPPRSPRSVGHRSYSFRTKPRAVRPFAAHIRLGRGRCSFPWIEWPAGWEAPSLLRWTDPGLESSWNRLLETPWATDLFPRPGVVAGASGVRIFLSI